MIAIDIREKITIAYQSLLGI